MGKKIIEIVADKTMKEILRILKEFRRAGKSLDDVITAIENREADKDAAR